MPEPVIDYSKADWGQVCNSIIAVQDSADKAIALSRIMRKK